MRSILMAVLLGSVCAGASTAVERTVGSPARVARSLR